MEKACTSHAASPSTLRASSVRLEKPPVQKGWEDNGGEGYLCPIGIGLAAAGAGMLVAATIFGVTGRRPGLEVVSRSE